MDFEELRDELNAKLDRPVTSHEILSYALYPKVFEEYSVTNKEFGDVSVIDTPEFLYGMRLGKKLKWRLKKEKHLLLNLYLLVNHNPMEHVLFISN